MSPAISPLAALALVTGLLAVTPGCSAAPRGKFTGWGCSKFVVRTWDKTNIYIKAYGCDKTDGDGGYKNRRRSLDDATDASADTGRDALPTFDGEDEVDDQYATFDGEDEVDNQYATFDGEDEVDDQYASHSGVNVEGHVEGGRLVIDHVEVGEAKGQQVTASSESGSHGDTCEQDRREDRALVIGLAVALAAAVVLNAVLLCVLLFKRRALVDATPADASVAESNGATVAFADPESNAV